MSKDKKTYREIQKFNQSVIHNFEVSVVMSFYKKLGEFKKVLPKNAPFFQRNGVEVIIVLDEPAEKEGLIDLIKEYPFINWKIIVNEQEHFPRNHAPVLNVGIKHATKKYILISDPEVEFYTDVIYQLRHLLENYQGHYATGTVAFIEEANIINKNNIESLQFLDYGSIMVEKTTLKKIGGYNEQFIKWGGEDDNIRKRLDFAGAKQLKVPEAKSLHREKELKLIQRFAKTNRFTAKELKYIYYPQKAKANGNLWGKEFNKVVYNWQNNSYAEHLCRKYLNEFVQYEIKNSQIFKTKYKKIILCQAFNESEFTTGFLKDMAKYFDGIIMLDDGSTDNTWQLAQHEKLLLKVKKTRNGFNDLENRNILLNIASFIKSDWFCFMDIDERFDERFVDFASIENNENKSVVAFKAVYMWNNRNTYYGGLPSSNKGILKVFRMFRPIGSMQINTLKTKLHFAQSPYFKNISFEKILVKDYGIVLKENRIKKYKRYKKEDNNKDLASYEYLLDDNELKQMEIEKITL